MVQNGPESLDWCRWSKTFQNSPGWFKTVQHGSEYFRTVESRMIISDGSMTVETEWSRTVFYLVQNKAMFKLCSLCWATKVVFFKAFWMNFGCTIQSASRTGPSEPFYAFFCFEQKTKQKNVNTKFLNTKLITWMPFNNIQVFGNN